MAVEDIIYGKNRHLFGGIEPSNMVEFSISAYTQYGDTNKISVNAILPSDTIVDGQVLCTVGGAIIRRKMTGYPVDEFDGDFVIDLKGSGRFIDTVDGNTNQSAYYYAAFPYSSQGVYNRNIQNRSVCNEPEPMKSFGSYPVYNKDTDTLSIQLLYEFSDNVDGGILCRSTYHMPTEITEDNFVADVKGTSYVDSNNVEAGVTYYYRIFPYQSSGARNYEVEPNSVICTAYKCEYLFGYDLDTTNSDPATRVTYPDDVQNVRYASAYMNYDTDTFNYGDWPSVPGDKFMPKPCVLTQDGTVAHYLNPNDYNFQEDGITSSYINNEAHNAMMEWGKIWTKRWEENGVYHFRCSDVSHGDGWECWCNYDNKGGQINNFYTAIYPGSCAYPIHGSSAWLSSRSGCEYTRGQSIDTFKTYATTNAFMADNVTGTWGIDLFVDRMLIQDLLVMMAKNTDCQSVYGAGNTRQLESKKLHSGTMDTKGLFWGAMADENGYTRYGVKVFGMEHFWGNLNRFVDGLQSVNGKLEISIPHNSKYVTIEAITATVEGYISKAKTMPWGRFPIEPNGSSSTYECDVMRYYYNANATYCCHVGGYEDTGLSAGPFRLYVDRVFGSTSEDSGAALSFKPFADVE